MDSVRFGILGAGRGAGLALAMRHAPTAELVACDQDFKAGLPHHKLRIQLADRRTCTPAWSPLQYSCSRTIVPSVWRACYASSLSGIWTTSSIMGRSR